MQLASLSLWQRKPLIFIVAALLIITLVVGFHLHTPAQWQASWPDAAKPDAAKPSRYDDRPAEPHPIDTLIRNASRSFNNIFWKESLNLHQAAAAYRKRRDRHPPPHFDKWYEYARKHDAVMIEDLFDQIYHDLEPFWGISPVDIRDSIYSLDYRISVRNGKLDKEQDKRYRMNFWHEMFQDIAELLPDVDMAFNIMDESRLLVPSQQIDAYMTEAAKTGHLNGAWYRGEIFLDDYPDLPARKEDRETQHDWINHGPYWDLVRDACRPIDGVKEIDAITDFSMAPEFAASWPSGSFQGYVANWTLAKDPCVHPHLRGLHGSFIEPVSLSTSKHLFPMFGGSKLPANNEILIPAPRYWTDEARFTGNSFWSNFGTVNDWQDKKDALIWRGVASGGRSRIDTWPHYHRHRFLSMLNSSHVRSAEDGNLAPQHIPLTQATQPYGLAATSHLEWHTLPQWVESFAADAAFTDLECFPVSKDKNCSYTDPYYIAVDEIDMYKVYDYKYLPDVDGNSFSGRYRAFLLSTSLPIKATIYSEWHDSRLWAWKHFVPMDNTFVDFYGIMEYFLGYDGGGDPSKAKAGHDEAARKIALDGKEWAEKVLRKEDMLIYVYRLVLEYARVSSGNREHLGYVKDL